MDTKTFFDNASEYWDEKIYHDKSQITRFLSEIDFSNKQKILDVGTGTGIMLNYILPKVSQNTSIIAVDLSSKMIEKAREKFTDQRVIFKNLDVERDYIEDDFDLILLYSVFPHLEKKDKALKRFSKSLNPGGLICIMHSKSREEINNMHTKLGEPVSNHFLPQIEDLENMAIDNNFKVLKSISDEKGYFFLAKANIT
ncbi:class I SAM-dependent methyltransferase [Natranaerobius trueperi]|uniref:SAM-dependent methyltransferase n=1 Tax=Natranaerobius trueperi TaxID=759412 RepID=A0A226BXP2_9FIRM|nr:class I SAM-dependent methyltransferase [Natranaerobius trueperi]OWZ83705.1 SAM-dependent methyltransferase [Natranaerobius trueperi]